MTGSASSRQASARKRKITKGQSLSVRRPGVIETLYNYLDYPLEVFGRATGLSERDAYENSKKMSGGIEGLFAPRSVGRALTGQGNTEDYINAGLVLAPFAAKPAARLLKGAAKAAAPKVVQRGTKAAAKYAARPSYLSDKAAVKYVREGKAADRALAAKPTYVRSETGPFLNVSRADVEPQIVPEAKNARDINEIRAILSNPETNPAARAADEYTLATLGRRYDVNAPAPGTSLQKQSGIARAFEAGVEGSPEYKQAIFEAYGNQMPEVVEQAGAQTYDQLKEAAYRQLGKETQAQFASLPVRTRYHYGAGEYATPSAMLKDVLGEGNLNVYRGGDPHEFLSDVDPDTSLSLNEMFRAVHDYYGHGTAGTTFRPGGEEAAYASHSQMMSPLAQMALLSETRGQNSLVNYSPLNIDLLEKRMPILKAIEDAKRLDRMRGTPGASAAEISDLNAQLRALGSETNYAPQSTLLLPPEFLPANTQGGMPEYLRQTIRPRSPSGPERAVHLSNTEGLTATDPSFYGTGHRGADYALRGRKGSPEGQTSFYLGAEGTVVPEKVVADISPYAYETELSGLYDLEQDPENLIRLARVYAVKPGESAIPDLARMLREYGYGGYRTSDFISTPGQGAANVFDPVELRRPIRRGKKGFEEGGLVN